MSAVEVTRLFFLSDYEEKRNSSKFFRHASFIRLAALASMAIALSACQEDVKSEQTIRPVKAIVVHQDSGEVAKSFSGDIRAKTESALGFRIAGKIIERLVDLGDRIKAGEVIAKLDDTDLVLSENSARAAVASAKTRLAVAKDALARAKKLRPKGYTPEAVVDQRQLEVDAALAALETAEAQARQIANATGYAVLKADTDGIVTAVNAEAGQVIEAGRPVVIVARSGEKEAALKLPEQDITQLAIGQDAELTLWADPGIKAKGKISEIAGQADPGSRTYAVRVAISEPPAAMRLGMTVTATLRLHSHEPYYPVPLSALTEVGGRKAVFIADRVSSKVVHRLVETDGVATGAVKVVSGLKPGEVVVTAGVQFLTDGMQVKLPANVVRTASAGHSGTQR